MTLTIAQKTLIIWRLAQNDPNYGSRQIGLKVGCSHDSFKMGSPLISGTKY